MTLILSGLGIGAVYALVAIGYNIVFVSSKTFNFAQAQLMMVGAFVTYGAIVLLKLPAFAGALIAMVAVAIVALVEYIVAVRPVKDVHNILVTTLGASIMLDGATQLVGGSEPLRVPFFGGDDAIDFLGGRVYPVELALVVVVVVLVIGLVVYGKVSLTGLALPNRMSFASSVPCTITLDSSPA